MGNEYADSTICYYLCEKGKKLVITDIFVYFEYCCVMMKEV